MRAPLAVDGPSTSDWYDPKALHTKAYERHLIVLLINSTISDVSEKEDVSYAALLGVLDRTIATTVDWAALPACPTLGIDDCVAQRAPRLRRRDHGT